MQIKAWIPNLFTLSNLGCGMVAIFMLASLPLDQIEPWCIAWLMIGALVFDLLDGAVARLLNVASPMGKELDSLADMVTFGVLPGVLCFKILSGMMQIEAGITGAFDLFPVSEPGGLNMVLAWSALLIPLFSCIRLAKFNIDTRQSDKFIGMPTPTNALIWLSLFLIFHIESGLGTDQPIMSAPSIWLSLTHPIAIAVTALVTSVLLVANIPLIALKFKNFSLADNLMRYLLLAGGAILVVLFTYKSVPLIVVYYFILSIIDNLISKQNEVHS